MEHLRGYKTNCQFSLERPRFGSIKVKIPRIQPFIAEEGKEVEEDDEAKSIGLEEEEEEDDHEAKSMDLEEGDLEEEEEEEEEEKKHICCECGKRFKSGKALGGHKRIHALETRKFSMVRPKMVSGMVGRSERGELEVACCVCYKKFTSMKALYGHMRFHPDRGWKGVLPPPLPHPLGNSSSSTLSIDDHDDERMSTDYDDDDFDDDDDDDDENSELWDNNNLELENVVDLKESFKGWSIRGKRGRRCVLKVDVSDLKEPPPEDMKDINDTNGLLFLATTAEAAANLNVAETTASHSVEEKYLEIAKKRKKKKKRLSEMEKESSSTHDHQLEVVVAAEEGGAGVREKHVCVTCNKSFSSYQALGGHRASHNKVKILENHQPRANAEASLLGTEAIVTGLASAQGSNTSLSSSNNGDHICNICHKIFPTGQALGGHKRCHWTGPVSTEAATAAPTAPAGASFSQATETMQEVKKLQRTFLEFDLNELPPNEDEEEERV